MHYLFGIIEPDCHAIVEFDTGKSVIICPRIPEAYKIWMTVKESPYYKYLSFIKHENK